MRYADPRLCPDCRSDLPAEIRDCPSCGLMVRHPLAVELFTQLTRADRTLADLRRASVSERRSPVAAGAGAPPPPPRPARPSPLPAYPVDRPASPPPADTAPAGLRVSSVPKILLGLGALCLLVAAVVFLAVTWERIGVGGRTVVLLALTTVFVTATLGLQRGGLRIAAESLAVVSLGLVGLDVAGGLNAGWLGSLDGERVLLACGLALVLASAALSLVRTGGSTALVAPQIIGGTALVLVWAGLWATTDRVLLAAHLAVLCCLAVVVAARALRLTAAAWSAAGAALLPALTGVLAALEQAVATPTLHDVWVEGNSGLSLLFTALLLLAPGLVLVRRDLVLLGASGAALLLTTALACPVVDEGMAPFAVVSLLVAGGWVLALVGPAGVRTVATAPAVAGVAVLVVQLGAGLVVAVSRWTGLAAGAPVDPTAHLSSPEPWVAPWALAPAAVVVACAVVLLAPSPARPAQADHRLHRLHRWAPVIALAGALGGVTTLASYDVAVVGVVAALWLTALAAGGAAVRHPGTAGTGWAVVATVIGLLSCLASSVDDVMLAATGVLTAVVVAALAQLAPSSVARAVGGIASAPALAAGVAGVLPAMDVAVTWYAPALLAVLGVACLARPHVTVEAPAAVLAVLALPVSMQTNSAADVLAAWLALAGTVLAASALIHPARRAAGPLVPVLWLAAFWAWLGGRGADAPEAYTLPAAAVLTAFGLLRLRRDAGATTLTTLAPGLLLATVPSLLWVVGDPLSERALLLGAACLGLTLAGAVLRWGGPLVVGAGVGAVLVLREALPYASSVPQWMWIGLAGAVLTVVGITWERRLVEVRHAVGALGRLR